MYSRRSPDTRRSRASAVRRESAARPKRVRLRHRANQRADVRRHGRSMRRRLFQAHHNRKPRRCQAMTVSGLTITSAVRHPVQMRESRPQSQRSVFASRNRRGHVGGSDECLRTTMDNQRRAPIPPESGHHDPKEPIAHPKARSFGRRFHGPECCHSAIFSGISSSVTAARQRHRAPIISSSSIDPIVAGNRQGINALHRGRSFGGGQSQSESHEQSRVLAKHAIVGQTLERFSL
jgi:hypothetical protein